MLNVGTLTVTVTVSGLGDTDGDNGAQLVGRILVGVVCALA